jgi:hypothetical protein
MKARVASIALVPAVLTMFAACGTSKNEGGSNTEQTASASFDLSGGNFSGNSVQICGSRPPVEGKYRCNSSLSGPDGGDCQCFNFNADGSLQGGVINGLCPSVDLGADASADAGPADWTFTYSIFTQPNCMGPQLNDGNHNFTCFDSHDIQAQANPNKSVEVLNPGPNANHILCTTENASKTFNFQSCAQSCDTPSPDGGACSLTRFNCGCTVISAAPDGGPDGGGVGGTCSCGDAGVTSGDLEAGCRFDPTTCDILCQTGPGFTCDDTIFISSTPFQQPGETAFTTDLGSMSLSLAITPIGVNNVFGYDATGYNPADNFLYAIANSSPAAPSGGLADLLKSDSAGNITDLGHPSGLPLGPEYIVGTFSGPLNPIYFVGQFTSPGIPGTLFRISVTAPPTLLSSTVLNGPAGTPLNTPLAWSYRPKDGMIWAYNGFPGLDFLETVDPSTALVTVKANFTTPIGDGACSSVFTKNDTMLLLCRPPPSPGADAGAPVPVKLWEITNLDTTPTANLVSSQMTNLNAGNLASCPFIIP